MLSKKVHKALNDQVNAELYAAYLYFSMSNWCKSQNLDGFAQWLQVQAQEEVGHALKIYGYLHDKNATVELLKIDAPPKEWKSPLAAFEDAYKHEQKVTGMINNIVNLAVEDKDHATNVFLHWFVEEQVEEEASTLEVVDKLKLIADHPGGVYMLDHELGARKEE
ncbi:MAG TPA: ferritin [archaeon]|nr:ferritin [archaeon]